MASIRWPHAVEWAAANNVAIREITWAIAHIPCVSESTHRDSIPTAEILEVAFTILSRASLGLAYDTIRLAESRRSIDWIGVEDGCVENVIQTYGLGKREAR